MWTYQHDVQHNRDKILHSLQFLFKNIWDYSFTLSKVHLQENIAELKIA